MEQSKNHKCYFLKEEQQNLVEDLIENANLCKLLILFKMLNEDSQNKFLQQMQYEVQKV